MTTTRAGVREPPTEQCVHHWIVAPPDGPTSGARCRRCGEERAFSNNPDVVTEAAIRTRTGFNGSKQSEPERDA
jgi:hypothetical protein